MANQPKKYQKFVATAATATLVASAIVPVASAASLTDIAGNTHEEAINALVDAKVISGYPDGTFKPGNKLTRSDVVKLLGKYLVSQGYEIPADAVSNPRFSDLKGNKELSEYAAVVADNGVFSGSNGKLLPADKITRENMAVVLVRMINTLKDLSLEEYVSEQNFKGDVKDLNAAKAEARTAISVLDFYDITNPTVANFNPKGDTTRGQFATFLYKTINTDFAGASATTGSVKAINNTTVEVKFDKAIDDIKALDFEIDGLKVTNAVVKQTDKTTVVLTTESQEAGKEYAVSVNGKEQGKFTGIGVVIPTSVAFVNNSVQGVYGQQATVQAKVTVAEGQSKENIPVTFYVPASTDGLREAITVERLTNAEGVASYTYTRYSGSQETVTAYSTGDRSKFSSAVVYWGVKERLTLKSATGDTVNNGDAKVYTATFLNENGTPAAGQVVSVTLAENIDVDVTNDSTAVLTDPQTNATQKPFQSATGQTVLKVKTNAKGEAVFTVTGSNTTATPIVFIDNSAADDRLAATELQVKAEKASFVGGQYTFEFDNETTVEAKVGSAKRYTVTVKKADGTPYAGGTASLALYEDIDNSLATVTPATTSVTGASATDFDKTSKTLRLNADGKASFWVKSSTTNTTATPVVWVDLNNASNVNGVLETEEPFKKAGSVVFRDEVLNAAGLEDITANQYGAYNQNGTAEYEVALLDQDGNANAQPNTGIDRVTYTIKNTGNSAITINLAANGFAIDSITNSTGGNSATTHTIAAGNTITVSGVTPAVATGSYKNVKAVSLGVTGNVTSTGSLSVTGSTTYKQLVGTTVVEGYYAAGTANTTWVNATLAAAGEEVTGKVVGFNTTDTATNHGVVYVLTDAGLYRAVEYVAPTNTFLVGPDTFANATTVTASQFEQALSVEERISKLGTGDIRLINKNALVSYQATANTPFTAAADTTAPTLQSAVALANGTVRLTFSENVSGVNAADYVFLNSSNVAVATTGNTVANSTGAATADNVWIITLAAGNSAASLAAATVEYRGTATVDGATIPNALATGSKVGLTGLPSFTVSDVSSVVGKNAVSHKRFYDTTFTTTAGTGESISVTLGGTSETYTIAAADAALITDGDKLATAVAAAINAGTTPKYTATASGSRLELTQNVASTTSTDVVTTVTLAGTGGTPAFAGTVAPITSLDVPAAVAVKNSKEFVVAPNTTGALITKNVTITVDGTPTTLAVQFAAGDNTSAAVATKIAAAFAGAITGYTVTVTNTNNVTVEKSVAGAVSTPAITLTIN